MSDGPMKGSKHYLFLMKKRKHFHKQKHAIFIPLDQQMSHVRTSSKQPITLQTVWATCGYAGLAKEAEVGIVAVRRGGAETLKACDSEGRIKNSI